MFNLIPARYRQTATDYFWRALQVFGKEGITFYIFAISAKSLNPTDFGTYNYILAAIFFLMMFGDFGISTATSKYIAEFDVTDREKTREVLFNSMFVICGLSAVVIIFTLIFGHRIFGASIKYLYFVLPLVFLAPATSLYDGIYRGLGMFKKLTIISLAVGLPIVILATFMIWKFGLIGALISQDAYYFLLLAVLGALYRDWNFKYSIEVIKEISKYSIIIGITALGYFFFTRINVLILGHYNYIEQIGYYELINKIFAILLIPFTILSQVIAPKITRLIASGGKSQVQYLFKRHLVFAGIAALPIALIVYVTMPFAMRFGLHGYNADLLTKMLGILLVVLVSQAVSTVASVGFSTASGHAGLNMYFLLFFGSLNIALTLLLVNYIGYWGAVYSTVAVKLMADIGFVTVYYQKYVRTTQA